MTAILPVWKTETRLSSWPAEVVGFKDHATYREHFPLLSATADVWDSVRRGGAVLVSEQLARRMNLGLGVDVGNPDVAGHLARRRLLASIPIMAIPRGSCG